MTPLEGFSIREITGSDTYRIPKGTALPTNYEEVQRLNVDANLVTTEDGLVENEALLVQGICGWNIAYVLYSQDKPYAKSGETLFMLEFVDDRGKGAPPRWVCVGIANMAALKRLNIYK